MIVVTLALRTTSLQADRNTLERPDKPSLIDDCEDRPDGFASHRTRTADPHLPRARARARTVLCVILALCKPVLFCGVLCGNLPEDRYWIAGLFYIAPALTALTCAAALIAIPLSLAGLALSRLTAALAGACLSLSLVYLLRFLAGLSHL